GSDVDGDALTYAVMAPPGHGTLTGTAPNLTYTPAANYNGSDSFVYRITDGVGGVTFATVSLTVTPVNDAPVLLPLSISTCVATLPRTTLAAYGVDGDPRPYLTYLPQHGDLTGVAPNLTYTPFPNYYGSDSLSFVVYDGKGGESAPTTVSILIRPVNDAP